MMQLLGLRCKRRPPGYWDSPDVLDEVNPWESSVCETLPFSVHALLMPTRIFAGAAVCPSLADAYRHLSKCVLPGLPMALWRMAEGRWKVCVVLCRRSASLWPRTGWSCRTLRQGPNTSTTRSRIAPSLTSLFSRRRHVLGHPWVPYMHCYCDPSSRILLSGQ